MLKLITGTIKLALFATLVLVLGNWIHLSGSTLSDHIKTHMAQVERRAPNDLSKIRLDSVVPEAARNLIHESRIESKKIAASVHAHTNETHSRDQITSQDQAQFRALLKDLTTHSMSKKQARQ